MSRAIHKMRGASFPAIEVLSSSFGNVSTTAGTSVTFSAKPVGSGTGRVIVLLASARRTTGTAGIFNACTVDGTSATLFGSRRAGASGANGTTIGCVLALTSESGNVDIVFTSDETQDSWGLSYLILENVLSTTPTNIQDRGVSAGNSVTTFSALGGSAGGISVGVTCFGNRSATTTWGSIMTKRTDVSTDGNSNDHRHSAAYDLLPAGRSASETVSFSSTNIITITTATFR